ncbi:hypothetical protein Patl1_27675 [Pistacia atlantica]|uniref:Uncharacterized protein n=1 Tax=Pistacia atlantica TaxID=434234 RepID=A0ACC1BC28_9ROSI|nr:hypothetical protein Patl1_27675 [Pistacia atlantica]
MPFTSLTEFLPLSCKTVHHLNFYIKNPLIMIH